MNYTEAIYKLREAKREALANSCNIKIGRRELEVALKALEIVNKKSQNMKGNGWYYEKVSTIYRLETV